MHVGWMQELGSVGSLGDDAPPSCSLQTRTGWMHVGWMQEVASVGAWGNASPPARALPTQSGWMHAGQMQEVASVQESCRHHLSYLDLRNRKPTCCRAARWSRRGRGCTQRQRARLRRCPRGMQCTLLQRLPCRCSTCQVAFHFRSHSHIRIRIRIRIQLLVHTPEKRPHLHHLLCFRAKHRFRPNETRLYPC